MDNKQRVCYPCHREVDSTPLSDIQLQLLPDSSMDLNVTIISAELEGRCRALLGLVPWDSDHTTGPPNKNLQLLDPSISEPVE